MTEKQIFVAMTGASGSIYGLRLMKELCSRGFGVTAAFSESGVLVCREETGLDLSAPPPVVVKRLTEHLEMDTSLFRVVSPDDLCAGVASGSAAADAMIIVPCSMGTVARIACGISGNLIERSADVMLKEHRPLLLVPRETPLSVIHLENMLKLAHAGARIIPAMPAFYNRPESIDDMVDFMVGKVLDQLKIENDLYTRWGN